MKTFLLASVVGIWATGAMAHSPLQATTPANEAVVTGMPSEVFMNFKGKIRLTRVAITHADAHSEEMDLAGQTTFMQEFTLPMPDLGVGVYVVKWRGLGADGHALTGTFSFTVK